MDCSKWSRQMCYSCYTYHSATFYHHRDDFRRVMHILVLLIFTLLLTVVLQLVVWLFVLLVQGRLKHKAAKAFDWDPHLEQCLKFFYNVILLFKKNSFFRKCTNYKLIRDYKRKLLFYYFFKKKYQSSNWIIDFLFLSFLKLF